MPSLDLPRLRRDLARRRAQRPETPGRRVHGSMAIVRQHLEAFEQMHRDGVSWVDLAAALAAQGVMQGAGPATRPITARRLTALVASVRRERMRRARAERDRAARPDLRRPNRAAGPQPPSEPLTLSPDLETGDPGPSDPASSTEAMRLRAFATVQKLLRKDAP